MKLEKMEGLFSFIYLHLDTILISLGFIFFVVGLFNIVPFPIYKEYGGYSHITFYEKFYSLCFISSVIFLVVGFALHFELFAETTFEGKFSSIMLCSSLPLLTVAALLYFYREVVAEIKIYIVVEVRPHVFEQVLMTRLVYNHPFMWLSPVLGSIGVGCLLFGLFLKLRRVI